MVHHRDRRFGRNATSGHHGDAEVCGRRDARYGDRRRGTLLLLGDGRAIGGDIDRGAGGVLSIREKVRSSREGDGRDFALDDSGCRLDHGDRIRADDFRDDQCRLECQFHQGQRAGARESDPRHDAPQFDADTIGRAIEEDRTATAGDDRRCHRQVEDPQLSIGPLSLLPLRPFHPRRRETLPGRGDAGDAGGLAGTGAARSHRSDRSVSRRRRHAAHHRTRAHRMGSRRSGQARVRARLGDLSPGDADLARAASSRRPRGKG